MVRGRCAPHYTSHNCKLDRLFTQKIYSTTEVFVYARFIHLTRCRARGQVPYQLHNSLPAMVRDSTSHDLHDGSFGSTREHSKSIPEFLQKQKRLIGMRRCFATPSESQCLYSSTKTYLRVMLSLHNGQVDDLLEGSFGSYK